MDELAGLPEEARRLAMERFRLLQPHLERNEPLTSVAKAAGIPYRTAHRLAMERVLEINSLREVNKDVVDAARESLVIGQA